MLSREHNSVGRTINFPLKTASHFSGIVEVFNYGELLYNSVVEHGINVVGVSDESPLNQKSLAPTSMTRSEVVFCTEKCGGENNDNERQQHQVEATT
ncbi:hypothetical protein MTR_4g026660 [Medicago truncatula]|uniref:Uncharacterized protein n=1 Tax=Medicago truncatula TaxID=3880 RepID=G7JH05_MEDTR|nr:hypothetical protein MTR_4g026660 [Medicago truncatula]